MNKFKVIGLIATGIGFVATILGNWAGEKQQDEIIEEKVDKTMKKYFPELTK